MPSRSMWVSIYIIYASSQLTVKYFIQKIFEISIRHYLEEPFLCFGVPSTFLIDSASKGTESLQEKHDNNNNNNDDNDNNDNNDSD